ncbi:MAG: hypothetical protein RIS64_4395 [Bacteroidota bacterium]|jgi:hypothetical protein
MKNLTMPNSFKGLALTGCIAIAASFLTLKMAIFLGFVHSLPHAGVRFYVHNQADFTIDSIFIKSQFLDYQSSMKIAPKQTAFILIPQQGEGSFLLSAKTNRGELLKTNFTYVEAGYVVHDTLFKNTISNRVK